MKKLLTLAIGLISASCNFAFADRNSLFSVTTGDLTNEQITVSADALILYEDSTYRTISYTQNLYDDFNLGATLDISEETNEVLGYAASIMKDDWLVSIEQSKLSGLIREDGAFILSSSNPDLTEADFREEIVRFDDNEYLDIKIFTKEVSDGFRTGWQYLSYERPSAFEQNGRSYVDPSMKSTSLGFVFGYDSVKNNMLDGTVQTGLDWYFYTTTSFLLTNLESTNPHFSSAGANHDLIELEKDSWQGLGMNGEYEIGGVYYLKSYVNMAIKAGMQLQMEGPLMFHEDTWSDIEDYDNVSPDEQTARYGFVASLLLSF